MPRTAIIRLCVPPVTITFNSNINLYLCCIIVVSDNVNLARRHSGGGGGGRSLPVTIRRSNLNSLI